jgi:hypothetical protein
VPLLDGRTVFYWVNLTMVVETKGEVKATFPINYRIRVCGDEVLSRVNDPTLYNSNLNEHVLRLPIRQVRPETYWYYISDYFKSNDPYCPILSYAISQVNDEPLTSELEENHQLYEYNGDWILQFWPESETFEDPEEGPEFLRFKITADTITQTNNQVFRQINYCDEDSQVVYLTENEPLYYTLLKNTGIELLKDQSAARDMFMREDETRCRFVSYDVYDYNLDIKLINLPNSEEYQKLGMADREDDGFSFNTSTPMTDGTIV